MEICEGKPTITIRYNLKVGWGESKATAVINNNCSRFLDCPLSQHCLDQTVLHTNTVDEMPGKAESTWDALEQRCKQLQRDKYLSELNSPVVQPIAQP